MTQLVKSTAIKQWSRVIVFAVAQWCDVNFRRFYRHHIQTQARELANSLELVEDNPASAACSNLESILARRSIPESSLSNASSNLINLSFRLHCSCPSYYTYLHISLCWNVLFWPRSIHNRQLSFSNNLFQEWFVLSTTFITNRSFHLLALEEYQLFKITIWHYFSVITTHSFQDFSEFVAIHFFDYDKFYLNDGLQ